MQSCIFCKIINRELPSTIIKESEHAIAIKNINPAAPIHYLVLPKKHFENLLYLEDKDAIYSQAMLKMIRDLGNELQEPQAFNVIANNGKEASQSVFHFHFHFLSGKNIYEGGLKL